MLKNISVKNIDTNNMKIIDIRNREKYNTSHIPGSINIEILDARLCYDKADFGSNEKVISIY